MESLCPQSAKPVPEIALHGCLRSQPPIVPGPRSAMNGCSQAGSRCSLINQVLVSLRGAMHIVVALC